jgi:hypothetical protein
MMSFSARTPKDVVLALSGVIASIPILAGMISVFWKGTGFVLFVALTPLCLFALFGLAIYWLKSANSTSHNERTRWQKIMYFAVPSLSVVTAIVAWLPLEVTGRHLGAMLKLAINHSDYERIIARVQTAPSSKLRSEVDGIAYSIDAGPPTRVAFNRQGFLDNWSGIVFDPSDDLVKFSFEKAGKSPSRPINKVFGGDLVGCRHLWEHYYTCTFT